MTLSRRAPPLPRRQRWPESPTPEGPRVPRPQAPSPAAPAPREPWSAPRAPPRGSGPAGTEALPAHAETAPPGSKQAARPAARQEMKAGVSPLIMKQALKGCGLEPLSASYSEMVLE